MNFRLFSFPIEVHWSFLIVALFLAGNMPTPGLVLLGAVVIAVSVLIHELGHAVAARGYGMAPAIRMYYFGGLTSWPTVRRLAPSERLLITLAGPGAGFAAAALIYFLVPADPQLPPTVQVLRSVALYVNVAWGILNLLPILPLDGGHALSDILTIVRGRSDRVLVHRISVVTGALLAVIALFSGRFYLAILAAWIAWTNYTAMRQLDGPPGGGWR